METAEADRFLEAEAKSIRAAIDLENRWQNQCISTELRFENSRHHKANKWNNGING